MTAEDIIRQLGQKIGLPLVLDANRACRLVFDGSVEVDIEAMERASDQMVISCSLGVLPQDGREALYRSLLEANLFGRGTGGAVLAVDERFDEIVLSRTLALSWLGYEGFAHELEQFVAQAKLWMSQLATISHQSRADDDRRDHGASDVFNVDSLIFRG